MWSPSDQNGAFTEYGTTLGLELVLLHRVEESAVGEFPRKWRAGLLGIRLQGEEAAIAAVA